MKLIIDIPRKVNEHIRSNYGHGIYSGDNNEDRNIIANAIYHGTPIPENATNGDVLKRLLYGKAIITEFIHDVNISVNNTVVGQFDREWWNSPYKRGDTE